MRRWIVLVGAASLTAGGLACGDDDSASGMDAGAGSGAMVSSGKGGGGGKSGASGSRAGTGGSGNAKAGTGGVSGSAGTLGASGAAGVAGADVYMCKPPAAEAGGSKLEGQSCCEGLGVCSKNPSGQGASGYGLNECKAGSDLKCAPMPGAGSGDDAGTAAVASCKADIPNLISGTPLEGRCIPSCFTVGDPTAANLGQSTCDKNSKCVPCYSPVTGKSTGACEQGGDKPAQPAPTGFPSCGDHDTGYCVPSSSVMGAGNVMLPQLSCAADQVCAPKVRVLNSRACFAHCDSGIGGPGVCIASFIVPESSRMLLMKTTCMDGEICVPCVSPLDQKPTGACN